VREKNGKETIILRRVKY